MRSHSIDEYQIGIICALPKELKAVRAILDEEHEPLKSKDGRDHNSYVLGHVGKHNVVAAGLPAGVYGTTSAASVAKDMLRTFSQLRFGLLVGIAGGMPNVRAGRDVRLGDVVVSQPAATHGGVVQYDLRKLLDNGQFVRKGTLNKPPQTLLTALTTIQSGLRGDGVAQHLTKIAEKHSSLEQEGYCYQGTDQDQLYCSTCDPSRRWWWILWTLVVWLWPLWRCEECTSGKVAREPRAHTTPVVHYGAIASGNTLLKNATERERLARELDGALCVEMEAAGLDDYPCLVIRGICDYADAYKNDVWQEYAALTAAAFAKVLLDKILPETVDRERPVRETLDQLQDHFRKQDEHNVRVEEHNQQQEHHYLSDRYRACHRLFGTSQYELKKNNNVNAVRGTCRWVLDNPRYREWLASPRGDLLWVSADPGCGKSVLAKTLVDEWLPSEVTPETAQRPAQSYSICYFFFKDNEEQDRLSLALCAILHQLFSHQPALIRHALPAFDRNKEQRLTDDIDELWRILMSSAYDPSARPIMCVLDALDECCDADRQTLVNTLCQSYWNSASDSALGGCLKWLVTGRPHDDIRDHFGRLPAELPSIRLPGEDKNDEIRLEIDLVINERMKDLGRRLKLSDVKRDEVTRQLYDMDNRTYLWLYLVLEDIEVAFRHSPRPNQVTLSLLPATVDQAYEKILGRITDTKIKRYAKTVLAIVVGARRPLTIAEMAIAFDVATLDETPRSLIDLTINADTIRDKVKDWCGLFVFIKHDRLYLIHQTAKEFLLSSEDEFFMDFDTSWKHCLHPSYVEKQMARICILFLCLSEFDAEEFYTKGLNFNTESFDDKEFDVKEGDVRPQDRPSTKTFFDFAAVHWAAYIWAVEADLDDELQVNMRVLYDSDATRFKRLAAISCRVANCYSLDSDDTDDVHIALLNRHCQSLQHILQSSPPKINYFTADKITPLSLTARYGYNETMEFLLAQPEVNVNLGEPLRWAAEYGNEEVVKLLLAQPGVDVNLGEPLRIAACHGQEEVVKLLLAHPKIDVNIGEPLRRTAFGDDNKVIKLLLAHPGVDVNLGQPLYWAVQWGCSEVLKLLLAHPKIDVNLGEPLKIAAFYGREEMVKLLLAQPGVDVNLGQPLRRTAEYGHEKVIKLLLAQPGVDVNFGKPLRQAAECGYDQIVKLLLAQPGVNVNLGQPLRWAALYGYDKVVKLLLAQPGVDVNFGRPLRQAAEHGHDKVVKLLLAQPGVDIHLGEPRRIAIMKDYDNVVKLLLAHPDYRKLMLPDEMAESETTSETNRDNDRELT